MTTRKTYKYWDLLDELPDGWKFDKYAGSPLFGYEFATNGESIFDGKKRSLVAVKTNQPVYVKTDYPEKCIDVKTNKPKQNIDAHYRRTVNELARAKFKERLLGDIRVDLQICEIEGWSKFEYIKELAVLINSVCFPQKAKDIKIKKMT